MFCAVKAIDWEGRDTVRYFQYTFDFYLGQSSVTKAILAHCGVVVPPIHSTRSWQTFTEFCCLVCQQYFASKALQMSFNHCFKTLLFDMWKKRLMWVGVGAGVGVGVGVYFSKPESESESESLKFGRLRSPDLNRFDAF